MASGNQFSLAFFLKGIYCKGSFSFDSPEAEYFSWEPLHSINQRLDDIQSLAPLLHMETFKSVAGSVQCSSHITH